MIRVNNSEKIDRNWNLVGTHQLLRSLGLFSQNQYACAIPINLWKIKSFDFVNETVFSFSLIGLYVECIYCPLHIIIFINLQVFRCANYNKRELLLEDYLGEVYLFVISKGLTQSKHHHCHLYICCHIIRS